MTLRSIALACATLGLAITAPLAAQSSPNCKPGDCPRGERMEKQMAPGLKLTDEQKSKMSTIRAKYAVELNAKRQAAQESQKAFHTACLNPDSTPEQLKKLHQPVADRQLELLLVQRAMRLEQRAILTPEQRVEADKFCQNAGPREGGKGHHRGGKGMGR